LKETGHKTVVLDTLERGHREAVVADAFIQGDIADTGLVKDILRRHDIEVVMHFSAYINAEESTREPAKYFRNNVAATLNLLDAMCECNVQKFVFSSSCATYGQPDVIPVTENCPQNPINPYGFTKLVVERVLDAYSEAYGLSFVALRYFNAAGADPLGRLGEDLRPETRVIPILLSAAAGKLPCFNVFGTDFDTPDGSCVRDYVHVTDLADAHIRALALVGSEHKLKLNLGTNTGFSVLELVAAVKRITGKDFEVKLCERRAGDPAALVGSNKAAREVMDWTPMYPPRCGSCRA
jgi:UDP-glucose 4-epimerase